MAVSRRGAPAQPTFGWPRWQQVFLIGLVLWIASVVVTYVTGNVNVIPTVVLLGSFLVPVSAVTWWVDHDPSPTLTPQLVLKAFIVGGVLGVLGASLLERWLLSDGVLIYLGVGLIEEGVKLVALIIIAWGLPRYTRRDGMVLGAAVGFGFGALESAGYALTTLLVNLVHGGGLSLGNLVLTEVLRGVLAPVGHGLWTAILGGVLFGASRNGRLRITGTVIGAYLLVSLLHALWDAIRGIAALLTALITGSRSQAIAIVEGRMSQPSPAQVEAFFGIEIGGLLIISLVGILVLRYQWLEAEEEPAPV